LDSANIKAAPTFDFELEFEIGASEKQRNRSVFAFTVANRSGS